MYAKMLEFLIENEADVELIRWFSDIMMSDEGECEVRVDEEDDEPYQEENKKWYAFSDYHLIVEDKCVAIWQKSSVGDWDENGEWVVKEDKNSGSETPEFVKVVLDTFGIQDKIPEIPEPEPIAPGVQGRWVVSRREYQGEYWYIEGFFKDKKTAKSYTAQCERQFIRRNGKNAFGPEYEVKKIA